MQPQEADILTTWHQNAVPWIAAIRNDEIESRNLVTNQAIIRAVLACQPQRIWDVGCGEGWLCRALQQHKIDTLGTDAIEALIKAATDNGGQFATATYQQLIAGSFKPPHLFDALIFNFSLFGHELVAMLLQKLRSYILPNGYLVIQTLHPFTACGDAPYENGWRTGSWNGFSDKFCNPAPWYFRTIASWVSLLLHAGFQIERIEEPCHPTTQKPASLILVARLNTKAQSN